ncbi:MAG: penicillin-insensitive murein endopeptidase [Bdellovibrionaceae bacterium]|nr:penicillin-insensitive murein endopeptidase [Pseudobdellovibrionaceae bacterium]
MIPGSWLDLELGGESIGKAQGRGAEVSGRLEKGTLLPEKGPGFVRLGGAAVNWGAGHLVSLLMRASEALNQRDSRSVIHIGGISHREGGRFQPHKSHQNGLDADILFVGRSRWGSVLNSSQKVTERFDLEKNWEFWRLLVSQRIGTDEDSESVVAMILVSPAIKDRLCQWAREKNVLDDELNRDVMRRIRPTSGHDGHFHLRLHCSPFHKKCVRTKVLLAAGDGCQKKRIRRGAVQARS